MPKWTTERARRCIRDSKGRFKKWTGGKTRAEDPRYSSRKGLYTHLTADFKRQEGRAPRVGDVHRRENLDGSPHAQSFYYIRTPFGWRRSDTEQRKPTLQQLRAQIERSRPRPIKR
jgi:hypothetical protein